MVGVGLLSRLSGYKIFHPSLLEFLSPKRDEVVETGHDHGAEISAEFKPITHPLEPTDEDHPVKYPFHNSSVLNRSEARMKRCTSAGIMRRRAEFIVYNEGKVVSAQPPPQAVRKRHQAQALPWDLRRPPLSRSNSSGSYKCCDNAMQGS